MGRWDRRLARLLRALLACTVLLFAAQGSALAVEPVRDVGAWVALSRAPTAPARPASAVHAARREPAGAASATLCGVACLQSPPPALTAAAPGDQRYLYLYLQTLRC